MSQGDVLNIFREAILLALKLAGPMLLISIAVGLIISILQAATQIHEQTLTFVPKVIAIAILLLITGSWMLTLMSDFMNQIFSMMAGL